MDATSRDEPDRTAQRALLLPDWKLPTGVDRALWNYTQATRLATTERSYFDGHPLLEADRSWLNHHWCEPGPLADLGSGTGRISIHFASKGFAVTAVDLSTSMLRELGLEAQARDLKVPLIRVRGDLGRLPLATSQFRYAALMFSTLGMIRGRPARRRVLREAARILKADGQLALHAHNLWEQLRNPQGRRWLIETGLRGLLGRPRADRPMTYRGIPEIRVHSYRWPELLDDLRSARLRPEIVEPIDAISAQPIVRPGWLAHLRAGGWLVMAVPDRR